MPSYEEMVREAEAFKDTERELEGLVPVKARVARNPRIVTSVRLSPAELTEISRAARSRGVTLSDFLRTAALSAVRGEIDFDASAKLEDLRAKIRDLAATVEA